MEGTEEAFRVAVNAHMKHGTTSIFPTLSSSTVEMIEAACQTCGKLMAEENSAVLGLHLEGPYFNPAQAGAQIPDQWSLSRHARSMAFYLPSLTHTPHTRTCSKALRLA